MVGLVHWGLEGSELWRLLEASIGGPLLLGVLLFTVFGGGPLNAGGTAYDWFTLIRIDHSGWCALEAVCKRVRRS